MNACPFRSTGIAYLGQQPEHLVVNGFRLWSAGYSLGDVGQWSAAWRLYAAALGPHGGRLALTQLSHWVTAICRWRNAPLRCFAQGCPHICRDECLAAAMIAACQNQDAECLRYCVGKLGGLADQKDVLEAAFAFAGVLVTLDQRLMAVPCNVVRGLVEEPPTRSYH